MPVPGRAWGGADQLLGVWQISHEMQSGTFILRAASVGQETGMQQSVERGAVSAGVCASAHSGV